MFKIIQVLVILVVVYSCKSDSSSEIDDLNERINNNVESLDIKPLDRETEDDQFDFQGEKIYTVKFYSNRIDASCKVTLKEDSVTIVNDGSMEGQIGDLIDSGIIKRHQKTSKVIITHNDKDISAEGVGSCGSELVVIDILNRIIWLC